MLCASCIAALTGDSDRSTRRIPWAAPLQFGGALIVLWMCFYTIGQVLLTIPSTYHDNQETLWDQLERMEDEESVPANDSDSENAASLPANGSAPS